MAYNRIQARTFLAASEIDLFESSLGAACKALGTPELRRLVQRARTLRDKARDLLQRQKLATRALTGTKVGTSGDANERTSKKAATLDEMLARFEAEALARQASPAAAKARALSSPKPKSGEKEAAKPAGAKSAKAANSPAPPRKRPAASVLREALAKKQAADDSASMPKNPAREDAPVGGVQPTGPAARARAVASRFADANLSHIQGHTSTQVRRDQAKRDREG